ncbi:unnamed protein product [Lactuca virosa]|uniref:EMC2 TPR-like domain-containing protein n=1 Tax=Lactuca virosa TaxID=75947 RepID=A0AAU9LDR7_9ASTR|nr:unnamed protein product [Lactuca virosa]
MGMHSQNYHLIVLGALGVVLVPLIGSINILRYSWQIMMRGENLLKYKQAGFCYEELILSPPIIPIHHLAYADKTRFPKRSSKSECSRNK